MLRELIDYLVLDNRNVVAFRPPKDNNIKDGLNVVLGGNYAVLEQTATEI